MVGARRRAVAGAAGMFAAGLILSLIPATSGAKRAAQAGCATRTVAVRVTGKDGKPVANLTPANFRAKASGGPVQVLSAKMAGGNGRAGAGILPGFLA